MNELENIHNCTHHLSQAVSFATKNSNMFRLQFLVSLELTCAFRCWARSDAVVQQNGVLRNLVHIERTETRTETSFDTVCSKEFSFSFHEIAKQLVSEFWLNRN